MEFSEVFNLNPNLTSSPAAPYANCSPPPSLWVLPTGIAFLPPPGACSAERGIAEEERPWLGNCEGGFFMHPTGQDWN